MGKKILVQRRGRGGSQFRSPSWIREGPVRYLAMGEAELNGIVRGIIKELMHIPGLNAPVARIVLEDGREFLNYAAEGMYVGQLIEIGAMAKPMPGNILPLGKVPEGSMVYNIEKRPNDGGKFVRSGGTYAIVLAHKDGGGSHQKGETPVPRNAPPGQKVGIIAPRCTGKRCPQIIPRGKRVWASGYPKKTRLKNKRTGAMPSE